MFSIDFSFPYYYHSLEICISSKRKYNSVELRTTDFIDSFMIQARAANKLDGNATLVGSFETIPAITRRLHCFEKRKSSVTDKGRPVRLGNMTFSWRAPPTDYGSIRFVASIVKGISYDDKVIYWTYLNPTLMQYLSHSAPSRLFLLIFSFTTAYIKFSIKKVNELTYVYRR